MPTTRHIRRRKQTIDDELVRLHLEHGDCLLAGELQSCACGLVGADGQLRVDAARRAWRDQRDTILCAWQGESQPWAAREFDDAD